MMQAQYEVQFKMFAGKIKQLEYNEKETRIKVEMGTDRIKVLFDTHKDRFMKNVLIPWKYTYFVRTRRIIRKKVRDSTSSTRKASRQFGRSNRLLLLLGPTPLPGNTEVVGRIRRRLASTRGGTGRVRIRTNSGRS